MRSSRSFHHDNDKNVPLIKRKGLQFMPFRSFRLGGKFTLIAFLILIFSMVSCGDNSGKYRGELSDLSKALSENYKDNIDDLKSYVNKDDMESYNKAMKACDDLCNKFNAFVEVKPSKKFQDKQDELKKAIQPSLDALDKIKSSIDVYKNSGKIESYKVAFEDGFKTMATTVDDINAIFDSMRENKK